MCTVQYKFVFINNLLIFANFPKISKVLRVLTRVSEPEPGYLAGAGGSSDSSLNFSLKIHTSCVIYNLLDIFSRVKNKLIINKCY